jgi:hypothetical protein
LHCFAAVKSIVGGWAVSDGEGDNLKEGGGRGVNVVKIDMVSYKKTRAFNY